MADLLSSCRVSLRVLGDSRTRAEPHVQAFLGPHGDRYLPLHGASWYKVQLVALSDHCQKQRSLHQSKVVADALVLARSKGDVCQVVLRSSPLWRETLGLKASRLLPEFWMAVNVIDAEQNSRGGRDLIAAERCRLYHPSDKGRHRRIEPQ